MFRGNAYDHDLTPARKGGDPVYTEAQMDFAIGSLAPQVGTTEALKAEADYNLFWGNRGSMDVTAPYAAGGAVFYGVIEDGLTTSAEFVASGGARGAYNSLAETEAANAATGSPYFAYADLLAGEVPFSGGSPTVNVGVFAGSLDNTYFGAAYEQINLTN